MCTKYIVYLVVLVKLTETSKFTLSGSTATAYPCNDHKQFVISFELSERPQDQENKYYLYVHYQKLLQNSTILVTFLHPADVELHSTSFYAVVHRINATEVKIRLIRPKLGGSSISVFGFNNTYIPYVTSIKINDEEKCNEPNLGVFDDLLKNPEALALSLNKRGPTGPVCGKRQLLHTELITNSIQSKPGDWPWHVAIYRQEKKSFDYKCGGTLISKNIVITAAHCVVRKGVNGLFPIERIKVYLGKYNLYDTDVDAVEREIESVKVHDKFNSSTVNHDIALMKLKEDVEFGSHIQPACLWNPKVFKSSSVELQGTVVGWGYDTSDRLSPQLRQATMPIIDGYTCVLSNYVFFGKYLDDYKFCAGYKNGTSACNGDSGGGFVVFAPDRLSNKNNLKGSWYIRGIVSIGVSRRDASICQPKEYVLFTDIAKYINWIERNVAFNLTDSSVDYDEDTDFVSSTETVTTKKPINKCGQKKLLHTELMTGGNPTKPGDWPWHAAIYEKISNVSANGSRLSGFRYRRSGTLVYKNVVLTVQHCPAIVKKDVKVALGKYDLSNDAEETGTQIIEVVEIVLFHKFNCLYLNDYRDIALMKLATNVIYTDYVQPICLWKTDLRKKNSSNTTYGTIPGWGYNKTTEDVKTLSQLTMPIIERGSCKNSGSFFRIDSDFKFCAGFANGSSPCNEDDGGALAVWVPDTLDAKTGKESFEGAWYARGVFVGSDVVGGELNCSTSYEHSIFSDLYTYMYRSWIQTEMNIFRTGSPLPAVEDVLQVWDQPS